MHEVDGLSPKVSKQEGPATLARPHVGWIGYMGFAAQIPWSTILVHLPILEPVLGGKSFSFAVGIAMGLACNLMRFLVVVWGRKFTFAFRVVSGAVLSALFVLGYFFIYVASSPLTVAEMTSAVATESVGFWVGLTLALLGGAGNAQLMSTGYGVASIVSLDVPVANSLFFFGQAMAAATCWPLKETVESFAPSFESHLGIVMGIISLVALSIVPVFFGRVAKFPRIATSEIQEAVKMAQIRKVLRASLFPVLMLWSTYFCTNLVTPGQLLQWPLPETDSVSPFLTDPKKYRSLSAYVHLMSDAAGKMLPVFLAIRSSNIQAIIRAKCTPLVVLALLTVRMGLVPLFYFPPATAWARFVLLAAFGLLNGSAASVALSLASARVQPDESDVIGYLCSFAIINGLFVGSLVGMLSRL